MGNGIFPRSQIRTLLELDITCNFYFDPNLNIYTDQLVVTLRFWSVKKNENDELTEIINEFASKQILLNNSDNPVKRINAEIKAILKIVPVDFSKFKSLDLSYASPGRMETITTATSSVETLMNICKLYLGTWIREDYCEDASIAGTSTKPAMMR